MSARTQTLDSVLIRSEGPTFDMVVREEDLAGAILTGITPMDLGARPLAEPSRLRGHPECIRGVGTTRHQRRRTTTN